MKEGEGVEGEGVDGYRGGGIQGWIEREVGREERDMGRGRRVRGGGIKRWSAVRGEKVQRGKERDVKEKRMCLIISTITKCMND